MPRTQRDPERERLWRRRLAEHQSSGLTIRQFCQSHGLAESSFHFWKHEIAKRDRQVPPAFVPVVVTPPLTPASDTPIDLRLATGHRVRVRAGCDRQLLADLLDLLVRREERPC